MGIDGDSSGFDGLIQRQRERNWLNCTIMGFWPRVICTVRRAARNAEMGQQCPRF